MVPESHCASRTPLIGIVHIRVSRWLDCRHGEPRDIVDLMRPTDEDYFEAIPVSDLVNKVANVGPDLQLPIVPRTTSQKPAAAKPGDGQMSLF